jgi:hypothetical protein
MSKNFMRGGGVETEMNTKLQLVIVYELVLSVVPKSFVSV